AASRPHDRAPAPATYDVCLQGLPAGNRLCCVRVVRAGKHESAVAAAELPPLDVEFLARATPPLRSASVAVWRDEVVIDGVQQVNDDVSIEPGTVVRLGPGACILFRGRVTAAGTRERPIRFEPKSRDQEPWGTVALRGPACSRSALQWCNMRGGSGYTAPLEQYSSMFSIHDCEQVSVADCAFAKNHDCDDMIHAVYASVVFDRATITGAPGDGLGCDLSTVVIRNCSFERCKNDGVDLMATRASIHDCRFEHAGDKGISIGERSHLLALRNRFVSCDIAMEARNGSIAHVANCDVRRCTRAMDARKKNWRYDSGGFLTVYKSVVVDNEASPTADRWSRLELIDCQVTGELAAHWDQQNLDGTTTRVQNMARIVDGDAGPEPRHVHPLPFPEDLRAFERLFAETWSSLRAGTRGVPDDH
ncbi:MAG TPA: right-handed parallel beta-helix repeat-containing protein, partial [Planctomycetota bacterium]|nr:right-handed parallel beta-helix repeat-containing protein [Planctomycetota bacterium]